MAQSLPRRMLSLRRELRDRRLWLGWSQRQLAQALGVDVQTVSRWESGRSMPQQRHLSALSQALKVDGRELARLLGTNVITLPTSEPVPPSRAHDPASDELRLEFLRAAFAALAKGDASSAEWRRSAQELAKSVGIPWTEVDTP